MDFWAVDVHIGVLYNYRTLITFLTELASATKKQSLSRAGLMGLAECVASAACGVQIHCKNEVESSDYASFDLMPVPSATSNSFCCSKADLLDVLRFIMESSKQHFNHNYRLRGLLLIFCFFGYYLILKWTVSVVMG